ncbi:MAG: Ni/Fe-hydrogenase, b-type cytochrome subunit [Candidatus Aminicenantales bacterium]|jgi:Ni/Fe-hydrogenase 1 B-type cytochrome subunit
MKKATLGRVYVWELPVRFYHWINFICVIILSTTGYLIGSPLAIQSAAEASFSYWFGTVRAVHFFAAYLFLFNFLFRIYWGFAGNRFSRWDNFILYRKKQVREVANVLKVDILQTVVPPMESIGHNALAGFTYFLVFLAFGFQVITGFGLYSAMSKSWFPRLFAWIVPLMGGDFAVRQWHHMVMWFFLLFAIVHVYLVFYHDYVEGRGVLSSMVGGWKFIEKECRPEDIEA